MVLCQLSVVLDQILAELFLDKYEASEGRLISYITLFWHVLVDLAIRLSLISRNLTGYHLTKNKLHNFS